MSSEGHLSVAQAVVELDSAAPSEVPEKEETSSQAADDAPAEETASATTDDGNEAETPGEAETTEGETEAETLKLEPPKWWSKEKKARFHELSPDLQAVVFEQEETRERVVSKAKQESADARKAADAQAQALQTRVQALDAILPNAIQTYSGRWTNVDWPTYATQVDAQEYNRVRAQFEQETQQLQRLQAESQWAETQRLQKFDREEAEKLKTVAPDLVDEKLGSQRVQKVLTFLQGRQFTPNELRHLTAEQASIAYDAMQWREAKASAAALAKNPKPPVQQGKPAIRQSAAPASRSPENAALKSLEGRFNAAPTVKNLEALLNAKG